MPKPRSETPKNLRPYVFHGVDLRWGPKDTHAVGTCPACGHEDKFSVEIETSRWRCFACNFGTERGGGNVPVFLRWLIAESDKRTNGESNVLAANRSLLFPETLSHWGAAVSVLTRDWIIRGYGPDGAVNNLYKYVRDRAAGKMVLYGTPDVGTQMFGLGLWSDAATDVLLCESIWDAAVLWETLRSVKEVDGRLDPTGNPDASLLTRYNVVAVPGCGAIGDPLGRYLMLFKDRRVTLLFHSDHPKDRDGRVSPPAGWAAARRATEILGGGRDRPESIHVLRWGPDGYDPDRKSGWDVRDVLGAEPDVRGRAAAFQTLAAGFEPVPDEWLPGRSPGSVRLGNTSRSVVRCDSWRECETAWRRAMNWRTSLGDTLSTMLSVALSTSQQGTSQLFLMAIGDAGSGKTRFCDAMLTSSYCHSLEHLTGFHSGWKEGSSDEDFSLLARINHKTLITPEGDTMMSNPAFQQIMSQQRRIFDGTSGASYKNRKDDRVYKDLRTPWIIAGTPALLDSDQSRLGDRFLKVFIDPPGEDGKRSILRHVGHAALRSVMRTTEATEGGIVEGTMLDAYRLTGGFVDHLRVNATEMLNAVRGDPDETIDRCANLAELVAILRARPNEDDRKKDANDTKELPTRITEQLVRMTYCMTAVVGREYPDDEVFRRIKKVAVDSSSGITQVICRELASSGADGVSASTVSARIAQDPKRVVTFLRFLERISAINHYDRQISPRHTRTERYYRLTPRNLSLFKEVYGAPSPPCQEGPEKPPGDRGQEG